MVISIIIPVYNNAWSIQECLQSLSHQNQAEWEAWVVDDASQDDTARIVHEHSLQDPRFGLIQRPVRGGPAAARNTALQACRGDIIVFLDGDSKAPPHWLAELTGRLGPGCELMHGPDYVPSDAPLISRCIGYSVDSPWSSAGLRLAGSRLVRFVPGTGNLALLRRIGETVGWFDEHFAETGEDTDFLIRVRQAGYRIPSNPEAFIWHHRRPDLGLHWRKLFSYGIRRVDIWRKHPGYFEWAHAAPALVVLLLILFPKYMIPAAALVLALDALLATLKLRDLRALFIVPWTSAPIALGYGCGIWWRLLRPK
jgi:glycosyltransferase involved in cell wall biosynthesis